MLNENIVSRLKPSGDVRLREAMTGSGDRYEKPCRVDRWRVGDPRNRVARDKIPWNPQHLSINEIRRRGLRSFGAVLMASITHGSLSTQLLSVRLAQRAAFIDL